MNNGLTIGQLGRQTGLSRSALLYYHRLGLLRPVNRSGGNYRLYSPTDVERLKQICVYRKMGIPLKEIARLLDQAEGAGRTEKILQRRLEALEQEIESLQTQQQEILRLLDQLSRPTSSSANQPGDLSPAARTVGRGIPFLNSKESTVVSKQRWVEIMTAAGFSEQDMHNWHRTFEKMEPQGHQEFLESLGIGADEIAKIREWSRR